MKNANEMRTIANEYNEQFTLDKAIPAIDKYLENFIKSEALAGNYSTKVNLSEVCRAIEEIEYIGARILKRHTFTQVKDKTIEILTNAGYKAIDYNSYLLVKWEMVEA